MTTMHRLRGLAPTLLPTFEAPAAAGDVRGMAEESRDMVARAIAGRDGPGAEAAFAKFNTGPAPERRRP